LGDIIASITKTIMQSVWSALPKFKNFGHEQPATPMRWAWHLGSTKLFGKLGVPLIQNITTFNDFALRRSPST